MAGSNLTDSMGGFSQPEEVLDELLSSFKLDEEPAPTDANSFQNIIIEGVPIQFPYEAYNSQIQMMTHIIKGVHGGENCLLESPTGTGKTAAILCSLLAWQSKCKEMGTAYWNLENHANDCSRCSCEFDVQGAQILMNKNAQGKFYLVRYASEVEDSTFDGGNDTSSSPSKKQKIVVESEKRNMEQLCGPCLKKYFKDSSVPRIYYATRTHSQIAQVAKQLKVTKYANVKMTILSSRQYTCVNEEILNAQPRSGLDDRCRKLRAGYHKNKKNADNPKRKPDPECCFYSSPFRSEFRNDRNGAAWDIEDIVKYSKVEGSCAFYGCRNWHEDAEIVFLPYNYLLSPKLRASANVRFPNSIIVFDEAHNIEQICCDSLTFVATQELVDNVRIAFDGLTRRPPGTIAEKFLTAIHGLSRKLRVLSDWIIREGAIIQCEKKQYRGGGVEGMMSYHKVALTVLLQELKLEEANLRELEGWIKILDGTSEAESDDLNDSSATQTETSASPFILSEHLTFFENLLTVLKTVYRNDQQRLADFYGCLEKFKTGENLYKYTFSIFCMNAGIAFEKLKEAARTIIVTSGTLSPTKSFASELETNFKQELSADHVVDPSQIWAGVLTNGLTRPLKLELNAGAFAETEYKNELGQIILNVCQIVPNGVLVFLPSYTVIESLRNHWSISWNRSAPPMLAQLGTYKSVFFESSRERIADFKANVKRFQEQVLLSPGAVLFAVFRGKVSEGVDFKDEQARAVVTIGIPFPYHGSRIRLKKSYNNERQNRNRLNGQQWYEAQAFRAMNQSFGRSLRHRKDWCALILIDSRIPIPKNQNQLSQWVRDALIDQQHGEAYFDSLSEFMTYRLTLTLEGETQEIMDQEMITQPLESQSEDCSFNPEYHSTQRIIDVEDSSNSSQTQSMEVGPDMETQSVESDNAEDGDDETQLI